MSSPSPLATPVAETPKSPVQQLKANANAAWSAFFAKKLNAETSKKRPGTKDSVSNRGKKAKSAPTAAADSTTAGSSGISKAARSERQAQKKADSGIFDPAKRERWKEKIKEIDDRAEFYDDDLRAVRCSRCGRKQHTRTRGDTRAFSEHWKRCHIGQYNKKTKGGDSADQHTHVGVLAVEMGSFT
ncbi:hypothetical protein PM082_018354 [Marasmius tenuissimus]|nr:hypothetical protein PM082_018354 [Marasmius tenuissimus]